MPAPVKSTEASSAGTNESLGNTRWFFDLKKSRYRFLKSLVVMNQLIKGRKNHVVVKPAAF